MRSVKILLVYSLATLLAVVALNTGKLNPPAALSGILTADGVRPVPWLTADGVRPVPTPWRGVSA
jgi:hypothetical protein